MIWFRQGRKCGRGIVLDKPENGVCGIVECAMYDCKWRLVLTVADGHEDPETMARDIDTFLTNHPCGKEPPS